MLFTLLTATSFIAIGSGLAAIGFGNWRPHGLKFAGVALSTISAVFLTYIHLTNSLPDGCNSSPICIEYFSYGIIRNIAFVIFHIACGRDAVRLKQGDRRCGIRAISTKR